MQKNWTLRVGMQIEGPFSEPEIRARLLADAFVAGAEVKQGNSEWKPASDVKQLFIQIYQSGWYVNTNGKTVGPFVIQKILDLHHSSLELITEVNAGSAFIFRLPVYHNN